MSVLTIGCPVLCKELGCNAASHCKASGWRPRSLEAAAGVARKLVTSAAYDVLKGRGARRRPRWTTPSLKSAAAVQ